MNYWDLAALIAAVVVTAILWLAWNVANFLGSKSWEDPILRAWMVLVGGPGFVAIFIVYVLRIELSIAFLAVIAIWWPFTAVFHLRRFGAERRLEART